MRRSSPRKSSIGPGLEERRVNAILDALHISDPADLQRLEDIAWERGAYVQERLLEGAEAMIVMRGSRAIITVSSRTPEATRKRFSIAHELGHFELHRREPLSLCSKQDLEWAAQQAAQSREQQANVFASALLMPRRFVQAYCEDCDPELERVVDLADRFGVSRTAAGRKFVELSPWPCALVLVRRGRIAWFVGSTSLTELGCFVDVHAKAHDGLHRPRLERGSKPITARRPVAADAWLAPGRYPRKTQLFEQTLWMSQYEASLTLLSIDSPDA